MIYRSDLVFRYFLDCEVLEIYESFLKMGVPKMRDKDSWDIAMENSPE